MGDNPNGGGQTFASGLMMLYVALICLIYWFVTISVSVARARYFTKDFMSQFESRLGELPPALGGAPDDGNGPFSDQLSYKDWVTFNVLQRIHKNFYETFVVTVVTAGIGCVVFPWVSMFVFPIWMLGRLCYGPAIMTGKMPIICFNLCCLIAIPFWALYGGAVGFILQPIDQNWIWADDREKHLRVAKIWPFSVRIRRPPPK